MSKRTLVWFPGGEIFFSLKFILKRKWTKWWRTRTTTRTTQVIPWSFGQWSQTKIYSCGLDVSGIFHLYSGPTIKWLISSWPFFVVLACHLPVLDGFDGHYQASAVHWSKQQRCQLASATSTIFSLKIISENISGMPGFEPGAAGSVAPEARTLPLCYADPHWPIVWFIVKSVDMSSSANIVILIQGFLSHSSKY